MRPVHRKSSVKSVPSIVPLGHAGRRDKVAQMAANQLMTISDRFEHGAFEFCEHSREALGQEPPS